MKQAGGRSPETGGDTPDLGFTVEAGVARKELGPGWLRFRMPPDPVEGIPLWMIVHVAGILRVHPGDHEHECYLETRELCGHGMQLAESRKDVCRERKLGMQRFVEAIKARAVALIRDDVPHRDAMLAAVKELLPANIPFELVRLKDLKPGD